MDAILAQTKAFVDDLEAKIVQRDNIIAGQDVLITEKNMYIAELKARNDEHEKNLAILEGLLGDEKKKTARLQEALEARDEAPKAPTSPPAPTPPPKVKRSNPNHPGPVAWNDEVLVAFKDLAQAKGIIYNDCKDHKHFLKLCKLKGLVRKDAMFEASARRKRVGLSPPTVSEVKGAEEEEEVMDYYSDDALELALGGVGVGAGLPTGGGGGGGGGR